MLSRDRLSRAGGSRLTGAGTCPLIFCAPEAACVPVAVWRARKGSVCHPLMSCCAGWERRGKVACGVLRAVWAHSVYDDVGSVKRHFSAHLPGSVFSLTRNLFPATKVRARIVRWNRLSSTSHLFDPDPRQDHDYLFKLPNALGRQDAHSRSRS